MLSFPFIAKLQWEPGGRSNSPFAARPRDVRICAVRSNTGELGTTHCYPTQFFFYKESL